MILIVLRTVLIRLIDKALQFLRAHAMLLRCAFQTIFLRGMNKYAEDIRIILQHIIRTPSDNDTGFLLCQIPDDLRLIVKQIVRGGKIITFRRNQFPVILLFRNMEQLRALHFFICIYEQRFIDATVITCQLHQLLVIVMNIQLLRQHLTDGSPAASILSCNGNDYIIHFDHHTFLSLLLPPAAA